MVCTLRGSSRGFSVLIIIIAGPAGLTLARLLQHHSIPCTVYEFEADRHARTQGGCLDIHEGAAQLALKRAGMYDEFMKHARPEGETLKIMNEHDVVLMDESRADSSARRPDEFKGRPEIDRILLRNMLLDSLTEGSVQWGCKLLQVEETKEGTYDLHFSTGIVRGYDLVVGADGAWSKVRLALSEQMPLFSGITGLDLKISDIDTREPALSRRVGAGMCLNLGSNKGILCQRNGDGCVRLYAFMRGKSSWAEDLGVDWSQPDAGKRETIEKYFAQWSAESQDLIMKADPEVVARNMYMLPIGFKWDHRPG